MTTITDADRRQTLVDLIDQGLHAERTRYKRSLDFRGLDLSHMDIAFVSLQQAQFDGANLAHTQFRHVDLSQASFQGAMLERTTFLQARGVNTDFTQVVAAESQWDHCSISMANFTAARLERARFAACDLMQARFDQATLDTASLAWSNLDSASFKDTDLKHVESKGINLYEADLETARDFAYNREFVIEILKRHTDRELPTMKWLGAVTLLRSWCYPVWKQLLHDDPAYYQVALDIFARYPASGCYEAFTKPPSSDEGPF